MPTPTCPGTVTSPTTSPTTTSSSTYKVEGNRLDRHARVLDCIVARGHSTSSALDLHGLDVTKVSVDGGRGEVPRPHAGQAHGPSRRRPIAAGESVDRRGALRRPPDPGRSGHLGDAGWEELTDGVIVAGQPHGAPSWFPCNDRPSNKASYRIERHGADGLPRRRQRRACSATGGARARSRGSTSRHEPMATYLATVHIGRYERPHHDGGRADARGPAAAPRCRRTTTRSASSATMIDTFTRLFGPYPFPAYTVVVTDDDLEIPLEAQGLSDLRRQLPDLRLGVRAAGRARAVPPVVRQQPDARQLAATSGCTRVSPATPSGSGRRSPGGRSAHERAERAPRAARRPRPGPRARRPRPGAHVRRPRLQARRADPARAAAARSATTPSSPCCVAGPTSTPTAPSTPGPSSSSRSCRPDRTSPSCSTPGSTEGPSRTCLLHRDVAGAHRAAPCHRRGQVGGQRHVHHPVRPRHRRRPLHDHR